MGFSHSTWGESKKAGKMGWVRMHRASTAKPKTSGFDQLREVTSYALEWEEKKKGKQGRERKKERTALGHMLVWVTAIGNCQAHFSKIFCDCCVVPFTLTFYFKMLRFGRVLKGHLFHLLLH